MERSSSPRADRTAGADNKGMTPRRLFPAACALAFALTFAPGANAALTPVFQAATAATAPGTDVTMGRVAALPDGGVVLGWCQDDSNGDLRIKAQIRSASGVWAPADYVSPAGEDLDNCSGVLFGKSEDGSAFVGWANQSYVMYFARLAPGTTDWVVTPASDFRDAGEYFDGGGAATGAPTPTIASTGATTGGDRRVRVWQWNGSTLGKLADIDEDDSYSQGAPSVAFNEEGDGILAWRASPVSANQELRVSLYDHDANDGAGAWSAPETVADDAAGIGDGNVHTAIAPNGDAAVIWTSPTMSSITGAGYDAGYNNGEGRWEASQSLSAGGPHHVLPGLVADRTGQLVAVWQEFDYTHLELGAWTKSRTFSAGAGWSAAEDVASPLYAGGAPMIDVNSDGDIAVSIAATFDGVTQGVGVALRENGAGSFEDPVQVNAGNVAAGPWGIPTVGLDDLGNVLVTFPTADGPGHGLAFSVGDGSDPVIGQLTVPASVTAGDSLAVAVSATDLWSGVESVAWSFGDGGSASGESASHTYPAAGTYTVTVTVTDGAGHSASRTRQVSVAERPAAPDDDGDELEQKPRQTLAPVIEARLAGRTITLNAKVTLKKGARCTGTSTAKTAFGGRSYKVTLKLRKSGGACRATGTIKLKKTPSLRSKLRITVTGKQVKSRTLTTRRG